ncbi:MAG: hypothetical protein ACE5HB_10375, partial [Terriglobia bacterium]
ASRLTGSSTAGWERVLKEVSPPSLGSNTLLLRPDGTIHFRQAPRDPAALEAAVLPWLGTREVVLTNPLPSTHPDPEVVLLVPLLAEGRLRAQVGIVFPFSVESLLPRLTAPVEVSVSLLDEQGTVLANTGHPEMVGRRIPGPGKSCLPCHTSFALERRMLAGESGARWPCWLSPR